MSEPSPTLNQLTLFAEAFPVNHTRWLVDEAALTTIATSGHSSPESFAKCGPDGSWLKTCQGFSQVTLDGSLARFSETWPRAGMTRNGTAYRRPPSAPLTDGTECGLWPTPTEDGNYNRKGASAKSGDGLATAVQNEVVHQRESLPTPTANRRNGLQSHGVNVVSGSLNPTWVEWLMGFPLGWTALRNSAMRSSPKSRR